MAATPRALWRGRNVWFHDGQNEHSKSQLRFEQRRCECDSRPPPTKQYPTDRRRHGSRCRCIIILQLRKLPFSRSRNSARPSCIFSTNQSELRGSSERFVVSLTCRLIFVHRLLPFPFPPPLLIPNSFVELSYPSCALPSNHANPVIRNS